MFILSREFWGVLGLCFGVSLIAADPQKTDWPIAPAPKVVTVPDAMPGPVDQLPPGKLYVIQSDEDVQLLASPPGLVSVTHDPGPIRINGEFVDGTKRESRTYSKKNVFTVERLLDDKGNPLKGSVELLLVPKGKIERRLVTDGTAPQPPPKPKDDDVVPPKPDKTQPVIAIDGVSVLVIYEKDDLRDYTTEHKGLIRSTRLYEALDKLCAPHPDGKTRAWRIWDKDDQGSLDSKAFGDAQARAAGKRKWVIISSPKGNYEGDWPKDDLALIDLVKKTTGQ